MNFAAVARRLGGTALASVVLVALPATAQAAGHGKHSSASRGKHSGATRGKHRGANRGKKIVGHVYTETNGDANAVVAFKRHADGSLTQAQVISTGGNGGHQQQPGCNPPGGCPILDTQGEVALTKDGKLVFAVNAGSNTISAFRATNKGLVAAGSIGSGGVFPESLTIHGHRLFVLDADSANIAGFNFTEKGKLTAISGSVAPLSSNATPGLDRQIGFDNTGGTIVVSLFGNPAALTATGTIDTFAVNGDGSVGAAVAHDATTTLPFGFGFGRQNQLVMSQVVTPVSEGTVATYSLDGTTGLTPIDTKPDNGALPCWIAITGNGRYVYAVNTGGGAPGFGGGIPNVSEFSLSSSGQLTLIGQTAGISGELVETDVTRSRDSKYLYVLAPAVKTNASHIDVYKVGHDGKLTSLGSTPSTGAAGLSGLAGV
jgi:6-phosphogluconolactonase (cycloisomerase 2 family)